MTILSLRKTVSQPHVYVEIQHEIPNDAPKVDIPEAKATIYVDESGNNVKTPDEGLHDGPKVIDDKWQYVKTIPEKMVS